MPRRLAFVAVAGLLAAGIGAAAAEPDADRLERLVLQDCGSCHGMTLKGGLGPDIRAPSLEHLGREGVAQIVLDGIPGTPMPPWRPLISEAEAIWIADFLLERRDP